RSRSHMTEWDMAKYLRRTRDMMHGVGVEWGIPIGPTQVLLNDYLNLDGSLSEWTLRTRAVLLNARGRHPQQDDREVLALYSQAFVQFMTISLRPQWTHLMVMTDEDIAQFGRFPQRHLAHQFMGIKTMLLNSYHQKRQADFSHAWRSFLKLGLVE